MRSSVVLAGFIVFCAAGIVLAPATSAPSATAKNSTSVAAPASPIAPHRAMYSMSLASVKNGGAITDVSGHMLFEWRDVCDGWAIQQHMQMHFTYGEGDDQDISNTELTWEAKDGKAYNFNIRHLTNGQATEIYRGKAVLNNDGSGTATYSEPEPKTVRLEPGTLFPSAHTQMIIQKAAQGDKFFNRRVFDGADQDGSSDINSFILPPKAVAQESSLSSELKNTALLAPPAWPVRMAFFKLGQATDVPDYEMDMDLLPNGVARRMKIDYGDFAVIGTLEDLQPLSSPHCP